MQGSITEINDIVFWAQVGPQMGDFRMLHVGDVLQWVREHKVDWYKTFSNLVIEEVLEHWDLWYDKPLTMQSQECQDWIYRLVCTKYEKNIVPSDVLLNPAVEYLLNKNKW